MAQRKIVVTNAVGFGPGRRRNGVQIETHMAIARCAIGQRHCQHDVELFSCEAGERGQAIGDMEIGARQDLRLLPWPQQCYPVGPVAGAG